MDRDDVIGKLRGENAALEQSNRLMEQELALLRSKVSLQDGIMDEMGDEIRRLRCRGFWKRVFNR